MIRRISSFGLRPGGLHASADVGRGRARDVRNHGIRSSGRHHRSGSTFVFPIIAKWSADYKTKTGNRINYQSIGSGGGLAQIRAATIDFGASDAPMRPEDLQKLGMGQFHW